MKRCLMCGGVVGFIVLVAVVVGTHVPYDRLVRWVSWLIS